MNTLPSITYLYECIGAPHGYQEIRYQGQLLNKAGDIFKFNYSFLNMLPRWGL